MASGTGRRLRSGAAIAVAMGIMNLSTYGYTVLARMGFYRELEEGRVSVAGIRSPPIKRTLIGATAEARPLSQATALLMQATNRILSDFIRIGRHGAHRVERSRLGTR